MKNVLEDAILAGANAFGAVFGSEEPLFPRLTLWSGEIAFGLLRKSAWLAPPLGPWKAALVWLMMRKTKLELARLPFFGKLALGIGGLLGGLLVAGLAKVGKHGKHGKL